MFTELPKSLKAVKKTWDRDHWCNKWMTLLRENDKAGVCHQTIQENKHTDLYNTLV